MNLQDVINKYFEGKDILYFMQSYEHKLINGDSHLRYDTGEDGVELYMGGENGEVCLLVTKNPIRLSTLISTLLNK